jgi:starch synthase
VARRIIVAVRVLVATAEYDPLVKVGGLGEAVAGLSRSVDRLGADVGVVVPDYPVPFDATDEWWLDVPDWAGGRARIRSGPFDGIGHLHAVWLPSIDRPHPYVDEQGTGWHDNDHRFSAFGAAVAALARRLGTDVLHLNDWHTSAAVAWFPPERTVLTVHNLAHQGDADLGWLQVLGDRAGSFEHRGRVNPLAAAIRLCDHVVTVSPGYAREIVTEEHGCGLEGELAHRGDRLVGIRNGLDSKLWDPAEDSYLPVNYTATDLAGKAICRKQLAREVDLEDGPAPIIGMVSRFVSQKGIDLLLELIPFLDTLPAQLVLHGNGEAALLDAAQRAAAAAPDKVRMVAGYDEAFAHLVVAGSDLLCVPSRFEPCGLTQMQAMTCGTIPVVTRVGGLADTVVDIDADPERGNGFVADRPSAPALLDAIHRAGRGWRNTWRRGALQRRGMATDWSWQGPGARYLALYERVAARA